MKLTKQEASFLVMCMSIAEIETNQMTHDKSKADLYQRLSAFSSYGKSNSK